MQTFILTFYIITISLSLSLSACQEDEKKFTSNTPSGPQPEPPKPVESNVEKDPPPPPPVKEEEPCIPEKVEVSYSNPNIQECFDQQRIWDFKRDICTEDVGFSEECTYDNLQESINRLGIKTPAALTKAKKGAKLIACGEKNDRSTVIAQWVYPPEGTTCSENVKNAAPVTVCYKKVGADAEPLDTSDKDAVNAFVYACIAE